MTGPVLCWDLGCLESKHSDKKSVVKCLSDGFLSARTWRWEADDDFLRENDTHGHVNMLLFTSDNSCKERAGVRYVAMYFYVVHVAFPPAPTDKKLIESMQLESTAVPTLTCTSHTFYNKISGVNADGSEVDRRLLLPLLYRPTSRQ